MSFSTIFLHVYLPLLVQEFAVMLATFSYGLKIGVSAPVLVLVNTCAVITDMMIFFLPSRFMSKRLHDSLEKRFEKRYQQGERLVARFGAFRTAVVLGSIIPGVAAMIVVGLLRLPFWRGLAGLFVGSSVYVIIPLTLSLSVSSSLPSWLLPVLPWIAPTLATFVIVFAIFQVLRGGSGSRADSDQEASAS